VPKLTDETLRRTSALNLLFAASSIGLLVTMAWMVYDDYSRGWKSYQKEFQRLEAEKTHAQIDAAEKALDKETLDSLLKQRSEAVEAATQHAKDLEEAQRKLREIETVAYRDDLGYRTTKSTFDAKKFDYEEAAHRGSSRAQQIKKEMDELQKELEDLRVKGLLHEQEKTDAQAVIAGINGRIAETDKKIADLEAGVDRLKKKLDKVEPSGFMKVAIDILNAPLLDFVAPSLKIQQVVLDRVPLDINFARVPRADRCQTCHLSADRAGFEDAAEPYRTHLKLNFFLGGSSPHPVDRFGCTERDLAAPHAAPKVRALIAFEERRARDLLDAGAPIVAAGTGPSTFCTRCTSPIRKSRRRPGRRPTAGSMITTGSSRCWRCGAPRPPA